MLLEHNLSALLQLHSQLNTWLQWLMQKQLQDKTRNIQSLGFGASYIRDLTVIPLEVLINLMWNMVGVLYSRKTEKHTTCLGTTVVVSTPNVTLKFNSLAPGKFEWNFGYVIFKQILVIDAFGICCEIALIWMSLDFTDDQSTLVQVMAWCCQATSHYLSQCWPRYLSPYGVTRLQWVKRP